jgi:type IV pilus assembly protein PilV
MRPAERVRAARRAGGVSLIEVLVAILILTIGLLGIAGLQMQMQNSQLEAYQRSQAIVLLQDMVDRINANRKNADGYNLAALGTASTLDCTTTPPTTTVGKDLCEWNDLLLGAAEVTGGNKVGAMIGARGCIAVSAGPMPRHAIVAIVWQGVTPTLAPAATACGQNQYGDEKTRRAMVASVTIGCLANDPTTGICLTP